MHWPPTKYEQLAASARRSHCPKCAALPDQSCAGQRKWSTTICPARLQQYITMRDLWKYVDPKTHKGRTR